MQNTRRDAAHLPPMWIPSMDVFLSHWFTRYGEARRYRTARGGYLFPFGRHYFVTGPEGVAALGLDPASPDWALIGFDWCSPADEAAWERLRLQREIAA